MTTLKPPRDHRGTHFIEAVAEQHDTVLYLRVCSSGGGTRTHNLRINSPPLCQLSYPGVSGGSLPTGPDWTRLTGCGSGPVSWSAG